MSRTVGLTATLAVLVLAATALAGCTAATAPQTAAPSQKPAANHTPEATTTPTTAETDSNGCTDSARILYGRLSANLYGEPVDQGERDLAAGPVGFDDEGNIVSYTVEPGDALFAIGKRFCITNPVSIATLNHTRMIHPGQVLLLSPDPDVPWVPYFLPRDAPAGFKQIPYQRAIEAMGAAADAGDVDRMRVIWDDELSGMFTIQANVDMIQQELETGDLDVLSQMFS